MSIIDDAPERRQSGRVWKLKCHEIAKGIDETRALRQDASKRREPGKNYEILTFRSASAKSNEIRVVTTDNAQSSAAETDESDEQADTSTGCEG